MSGLLIADSQYENRLLLLQLFWGSGVSVTVCTSASGTLDCLCQGEVDVVLLGSLEGLSTLRLVPLLRACDPRVSIILVTSALPLPQLRQLRRTGIFYHALPPVSIDDGDELRQAVACALVEHRRGRSLTGKSLAWSQTRNTH